MALAQQQNCEQILEYGHARARVAVRTSIVANRTSRAASTHRRAVPNAAPAQPSETEAGHVVPLVRPLHYVCRTSN